MDDVSALDSDSGGSTVPNGGVGARIHSRAILCGPRETDVIFTRQFLHILTDLDFSHVTQTGLFITFEGPDGCGKSTQIDLLVKWLQSKGRTVYFSEWNSSGLVKSTTRLGKKEKMFTPTSFSLLQATDFADRWENFILPQLKAGAIVLDGEGVAEGLRALHGPDLPIIIVSSDRMLRERAKGIGVSASISKPFEIEELLAAVHLAEFDRVDPQALELFNYLIER